MEREELCRALLDVLNGAYGEPLDNIAMWLCIKSLRVEPERTVSGKFCYSYRLGGCLIYGEGDTIYDAAIDFYNNIKGK